MKRERAFQEKRPQMLLLGDASRPEFAAALADVLPHAVRGPCDFFSLDLTSAVWERPTGEGLPRVRWLDLPLKAIVLLQSRPGEWSEAQLAALRSAWPLARIALLLGSWCEGEMRTGRPLAGVERIYWHQGLRLQTWLNAAHPLPATATNEERLLAQQAITFSKNCAPVAIAARHSIFAEGIAEACESMGLATVCLDETDLLVPSPRFPVRGAAALLWHLERPTALVLEQVREVSHRLRQANVPLVPLLGFPRHEDRMQLLAAGARAIVSLPMQLNDLAACLLDILGREAVLAETLETTAAQKTPQLPAA